VIQLPKTIREAMANKNKPNVLFWILILTISSAISLLIYSLIQFFLQQGDFVYKTNVGDILGVITSILILISCYLFIRNHSSDLYGLPKEQKLKKKKNHEDKYLDNGNDKTIPKWLLLFVYVVFLIQIYNLIKDLIQ